MMTLEDFLDSWRSPSKTILVHTSGSTGKPKPLMVEKQRMLNSAKITCDFLGLQVGDTALLCMSLDYIAGKMVVVRSLERGLRLLQVTPSGHPLAEVSSDKQIDFAAMVPMQVYNSLQVPVERERLLSIKNLLIGGGAIDEKLASELRSFPHAVWSTYGMTETLSHIALRRLNGPSASEWYTPFEHVQVNTNEDGCLVINAPLVCTETLVTHDIAEIKNGKFRIKGRKDNVICSGGIKIQIEEVEDLLRPVLSSPFMLVKKKDEKFGEVAVLVTENQDLQQVEDVCRCRLPKYWIPREYLYVDKLPLTETGKPKRAILL